jgi:SAM-dependent methyltransferase
MTSPTRCDSLRPTPADAAEAWAERVRAGREQLERLREVDETTDFYRSMARRFGLDPRRTDEPALETLRRLAQPGQTWLDIGAGGGRYALPLALVVDRVLALEPSPSMLEVLRAGMIEHGIDNVEIIEDRWPTEPMLSVDVALMAHVGYDIEEFAAFLDAAEEAADRCVAIMRTSASGRASFGLWPEVHGEARSPYPMLPELLTLLVARGTVPEVTLVERGMWGFGSPEQMIAPTRRLLGLRAGSEKDRRLVQLIEERATERGGQWEVDWSPMHDGIVTWDSPPT